MTGAWTGAGGRVRSEERPSDLFRLDREAVRNEAGEAYTGS